MAQAFENDPTMATIPLGEYNPVAVAALADWMIELENIAPDDRVVMWDTVKATIADEPDPDGLWLAACAHIADRTNKAEDTAEDPTLDAPTVNTEITGAAVEVPSLEAKTHYQRFGTMDWRKLQQTLLKAGLVEVQTEEALRRFRNPENEQETTFPVHSDHEFGDPYIRKVLSDLGLTEDGFRRAYRKRIR